jgi:hypothetical protein
MLGGRTIVQAVSRRLLTAAVRVRAWVRTYRICGGKSGTGAGVFRFEVSGQLHVTAALTRYPFGR